MLMDNYYSNLHLRGFQFSMFMIANAPCAGKKAKCAWTGTSYTV